MINLNYLKEQKIIKNYFKDIGNIVFNDNTIYCYVDKKLQYNTTFSLEHKNLKLKNPYEYEFVYVFENFDFNPNLTFSFNGDRHYEIPGIVFKNCSFKENLKIQNFDTVTMENNTYCKNKTGKFVKGTSGDTNNVQISAWKSVSLKNENYETIDNFEIDACHYDIDTSNIVFDGCIINANNIKITSHTGEGLIIKNVTRISSFNNLNIRAQRKFKLDNFSTLSSKGQIDIDVNTLDINKAFVSGENITLFASNIKSEPFDDTLIIAKKGILAIIDCTISKKLFKAPYIILNDSIVDSGNLEENADLSLIKPRCELINTLKEIRTKAYSNIDLSLIKFYNNLENYNISELLSNIDDIPITKIKK